MKYICQYVKKTNCSYELSNILQTRQQIGKKFGAGKFYINSINLKLNFVFSFFFLNSNLGISIFFFNNSLG